MRRWLVVLSALVMLAWAGLATACPSCKESIPTTDAQQAGGVPGGINTSVFVMLGAFMTVLGSVLWMVVKAARSGAGSWQNRRLP